MIRLGITGSIGMGKSMTADLLRSFGVPVYGSDEAVHKLLGPKGAGVAAIRALCPQTYDARHQSIDRADLGRRVFSDPALRRAVEGVLHPLVQVDQTLFERHHRRAGTKIIAFDIPLLFETGAEGRVDHVITVWAPPFLQAQRALRRPGMTAGRLHQIRAAQWPDALKKRRAHSVLATSLGRGHTARTLKKILLSVRTFHA